MAALLAVEGANTARLLAAHAATDGVTTDGVTTDGAATGEAGASARLTLALGESPLAVRPEAAREDGWGGVEGVAWSGALETLFGVLHERANRVYNTRGLSGWKAKWRHARRATTAARIQGRAPIELRRD